MSNNIAAALSVAGSDSGGGAGVQADLLTFAAFGVFGATALAGLTAQNPDGVCAVAPVDPAFVRAQMLQVGKFFALKAVKTGMLTNAPTMRAVAEALHSEFLRAAPLVLDPVMISTSGARLMDADAVDTLVGVLFPRACVITPNLDEAAVLLDGRKPDAATLEADARSLAQRYHTAVLLKGGHLAGGQLTDVLALADGQIFQWTAGRVEGVDTHGSGCTLSSAIAAGLALGESLPHAVGRAHAYLQRALTQPLRVGGRAFINHGVRA